VTTVVATQPRLEAAVSGPSSSVSAAQGPSVTVELGIRGPAGAGASTYVHDQASPASVWTVNHNLGRSPMSVRVLTVGGVEVEAQVTEASANQLTVNLASPQAGRVLVS